jgi:hypothetical protein
MEAGKGKRRERKGKSKTMEHGFTRIARIFTDLKKEDECFTKK